MSCLEYHEVPLHETGILREGQSEVWFKNVVHDVRSYFLLSINTYSFVKSRPMSFLMA